VAYLNKRTSLDIFNIDPHIGVRCVAMRGSSESGSRETSV